ncbi:MAG: sigma-70 factor domain-containing protein, partial [Pirellula sp.]
MTRRNQPRSNRRSRNSGFTHRNEDRDFGGSYDAFYGEEILEEEEEEDVDGEDFGVEIDEDLLDEEMSLWDEADGEVVDATEDPVRMYLMQMGEIHLLTRQQEVTAAKQIEMTRCDYRQWMLATDFMLQGATKLLEQVRDGKLRLDRTIEVSVTNATEKVAIMRRIGPNIKTLRHLLLRNHGDYYLAIDKSKAMEDRRNAWKRLVCRRNKAVRLVEEMNLRTNRLEPMFNK